MKARPPPDIRLNGILLVHLSTPAPELATVADELRALDRDGMLLNGKGTGR
jgi:hypothetical protein